MGAFVWIGAFVTLVGLMVLIYCIRTAIRLRKTDAGQEDLRVRMQSLAAWNMGALGLSAIGLMMVIIGLTFG